jgi:lipopolysaccharide export system protein LptA
MDKKNEMVIKGEILENRDEEGIVLIQIGVRILGEDLVCRSQMVRYHRESQQLELSGVPFVRWKRDEYRATKIFIDLENDTIQMEGQVQATVRYEEEEGE